jgi:polysaccharide deacetylase 2 family uncharacterized protein YibQ
MPKRRSSPKKGRGPLWLGLLAALALLLFAGGELYVLARSDGSRIFLWRNLYLGDRAHAVRIVGRHAREGLAALGVPAARIHEEVISRAGRPPLRWTVDLPRGTSPTQANYAVTQAVQGIGAEVLAAREEPAPEAGQLVTKTLGVPGRLTHEVALVRAGLDPDSPAATETRVAIVLFGLADDPASAKALLARPEPFAVIAPAIGQDSDPLIKLAHESRRQLVLQVPMEPEDYPRANPGPGTLLVNMTPGRIEKMTRDYLEQAGDVTAVMNLQGSFAVQDEPFMTAFYTELKHAGLTFLHLSPPPRSVARPLAARLGVGYDEPDVILDDEARGSTTKSLDRAWAALLERRKGGHTAIVLLRATPASVKWAQEALVPKKLEGEAHIVPLSAVLPRIAKG